MPAQKKCLGPQRTITIIRQARLKVNLPYVAGPPPLAYFDENVRAFSVAAGSYSYEHESESIDTGTIQVYLSLNRSIAFYHKRRMICFPSSPKRGSHLNFLQLQIQGGAHELNNQSDAMDVDLCKFSFYLIFFKLANTNIVSGERISFHAPCLTS